MKSEFRMLIGGEQIGSTSQATMPCISPTDGTEWATVPQATEADVASAVSAARQAFDGAWVNASGVERARLLTRLADLLDENAPELARMETTDNGKVLRETISQVHFAARTFRYYAGYADKLTGDVIPLEDGRIFDYTIWEPRGVVALLTAWNSPIALLANKLPAALATGNCAVVKPSEHASATSLAVGELVTEAGFPPGVINIVTGGADVGTWLASSDGIDGLSLTGGVETGRKIAEIASRNLVPLTLELGGKSSNIIFSDAPMDQAINGAVAGIFAAAGQTCVAGSRLLVEARVYEEVINRVAERATRVRLGDPLDMETEMGPVGNPAQCERVLRFIEGAREQGASVLAGGARVTTGNLSKGLFVAPTVLGGVTSEMTVAREEIFGPVLSVIPFETEEEAVEIANGTNFGLAAGIWTKDARRMHQLPRRLKAGVVWVNTYRTNAAQAPFGGVGLSGYGRERGWYGLLEYINVKNIMVDTDPAERDPFVIRT
jgi:aldehyde dehydrogenase (NAD+)